MEFFMQFQEAHPMVIVGKRMFDSLRPFFIKALKERNVCCCIYHVETDELRIALNFMRLKSRLHNSKICDVLVRMYVSQKGKGFVLALSLAVTMSMCTVKGDI